MLNLGSQKDILNRLNVYKTFNVHGNETDVAEKKHRYFSKRSLSMNNVYPKMLEI